MHGVRVQRDRCYLDDARHGRSQRSAWLCRLWTLSGMASRWSGEHAASITASGRRGVSIRVVVVVVAATKRLDSGQQWKWEGRVSYPTRGSGPGGT